MGCRTDDPTLSDLLESLIGALYRDQGLVACQRFVRRQIIDTTKLDPQVQPRLSRKSSLISFVNTRSLGHIAFKTKLSRKVLSNGIHTSTWVTEVSSMSCNHATLATSELHAVLGSCRVLAGNSRQHTCC